MIEDNKKGFTKFEIVLMVLGVIAVELYFLSPSILMFKYLRGKCQIIHIPIVQIIFNFVNCASYLVSGVSADEYQQIICNTIGLIISFVFLILIWILYPQDKVLNKKEIGNRTETMVYLFMIFNIIFQIFYFSRGYEEFVKIFSCIWNVLMYAAGFINVYEANKAQNADLILWQGSLCGLLSAIFWICFSIEYIILNKKEGFNKYYPSLIANSVSCLVLLGIIYMYKRLKNKFESSRSIDSNSLVTLQSNESSKTKSLLHENQQDKEFNSEIC